MAYSPRKLSVRRMLKNLNIISKKYKNHFVINNILRLKKKNHNVICIIKILLYLSVYISINLVVTFIPRPTTVAVAIVLRYVNDLYNLFTCTYVRMRFH